MMKKISLAIRIILIIVILGTGFMNASAQFFKELKQQVKDNVKGTVEQRSVEKANNGANAAIDKASSAVGAAIGKTIKKGKKSEQDDNSAGDPDM